MPDISSVVQALKGQLNLQPDVNTPLASSAAVSAKTVQPSDSPATQEASTRRVLDEISAGSAPAPEKDLLSVKDKAIEDLRLQNEGLQQNVASLTDKMQQFMDALAKPQDNKAKTPELRLPEIPDDISQRPADEQVSILTKAYSDLQSTVKGEFTTQHENLKKFLGPLAFEVAEMKKAKDRQMVSERFPKFDWKKNQQGFEKKMFTVPGLSPLEAAKLVADPQELLQSEPTPDYSERTLPSVAASSGRPASAQSANEPSDADVSRRLSSAIVGAHQRGNSVQAKQLFDVFLKHKLPNCTVRG